MADRVKIYGSKLQMKFRDLLEEKTTLIVIVVVTILLLFATPLTSGVAPL